MNSGCNFKSVPGFDDLLPSDVLSWWANLDGVAILGIMSA